MFEKMCAYAPPGDAEASTALLYVGYGSYRFVSYPAYSYLRGSRFYLYAQGFDGVYAVGFDDGLPDYAVLFDSPGDDVFENVQTTHGELRRAIGSTSGFIDFDDATIVGSAGGINLLKLGAIDYALHQVGTWTPA